MSDLVGFDKPLDLIDFVQAHTARGECGCGACIDRGDTPEPGWFSPHVVDMVFFRVALVGEADDPDLPDDFRLLSAAHRAEFGDERDPLAEPMTYIELGGWLGDQGLALRYMALGTLLGVFALITPYTLMPDLTPAEALAMAGQGMVMVRPT